jgi:hypothetical protein
VVLAAAWTAGVTAGLAATPADPPARAVAQGARPRVAKVTLGIRHRVFPDFAEKTSVKIGEEFPIGDSRYTGKVVEFVPDFSMDLKSKKVVSRSNELRNPAFRIIVRERGVPQDTSWAFVNMPPHFARNSMLAFKVLRVDFTGRAPLIADSTVAAPKEP